MLEGFPLIRDTLKNGTNQYFEEQNQSIRGKKCHKRGVVTLWGDWKTGVLLYPLVTV